MKFNIDFSITNIDIFKHFINRNIVFFTWNSIHNYTTIIHPHKRINMYVDFNVNYHIEA